MFQLFFWKFLRKNLYFLVESLVEFCSEFIWSWGIFSLKNLFTVCNLLNFYRSLWVVDVLGFVNSGSPNESRHFYISFKFLYVIYSNSIENYSLIIFWSSLVSVAIFRFSYLILLVLASSCFWLIGLRVCQLCLSFQYTSSYIYWFFVLFSLLPF